MRTTLQPLPQSGSESRRAAAAVEFAVIAPVLILFLFGAIDFGRAMMVSNLLTSAAREGARIGVVPNTENVDIRTLVNANLNSVGVPSTHAVTTIRVNGVTKDVSTAMTGDLVSVTVTMPFNKVSWLPTSWFLKDATLQGRAVMRRE